MLDDAIGLAGRPEGCTWRTEGGDLAVELRLSSEAHNKRTRDDIRMQSPRTEKMLFVARTGGDSRVLDATNKIVHQLDINERECRNARECHAVDGTARRAQRASSGAPAHEQLEDTRFEVRACALAPGNKPPDDSLLPAICVACRATG